MRTAIVYASVHHGNTEKLVKRIAERGKGISIIWTCGLWRLWGNDDQTGCSGRRKGICLSWKMDDIFYKEEKA